MKARLLLGGALLLCGALVLAAGEFWKEKPYTTWTAEEVRKLLNDSPWARRVEVAAGAPVSAERPDNPLSAAAGPAPYGSVEGAGPAQGQSGQVPAGGYEGEHDVYLVQWWSAAILRQAAVRGRQLRGTLSDAEGEQFLAQRPAEYIIAVAGTRMEEFEGLPAEQLQEKAYLKIKSQQIAPLRVNLIRGADTKLRILEFYFAREVKGEPLIPAQEKSVEFSCRGKRTKIHAKFDLSKMRVGSELLL